jgi:transcriptional regulator with XRE-family HTH domain
MKLEKIPVALRIDAEANLSGAEMTTSPVTTRFGATVRRLRHGLGISQEAFAERADLHRTYVADVEGGRRNVTLKTLERLARALEVSMAALLAQTGESDGRLERAGGGQDAGQHGPILGEPRNRLLG